MEEEEEEGEKQTFSQDLKIVCQKFAMGSAHITSQHNDK